MLNPGDPAPDFELPNADMEMMRLDDFRGSKNLVLYFYPKDDTPGCTLESIEFSDLVEEFGALDTEIVGISKDNCLSHGNFRDKHGLTVWLLADVEGITCEAYGVWQEKEAHGKKSMGIARSTFIIDQEGKVHHALYNIKPGGHAEQVLELVKGL
jgi:peroxiredoxin Q/BCP/two-component system osmolarity sensor histidine kinase EnvZ